MTKAWQFWPAALALLSGPGCGRANSDHLTGTVPLEARGLRLPIEPLETEGNTVSGVYSAPTSNLTTVANGISFKHKSLTTVIGFRPGLVVTNPVRIAIEYGAGYPRHGFSQDYDIAGNRFFYVDSEGNGKPRQLPIAVSLTELMPGGGAISFALQFNAYLDPLYDVAISKPQFVLTSNCDYLGASEINFLFHAPDGPSGEPEHYSYELSWGQSQSVGRRWSRTEVSASEGLVMPQFAFVDSDLLFDGYDWSKFWRGLCFSGGTTPLPLVPGKTYAADLTLENGDECDLVSECDALLNYTITYSLREYPNL